MIRAAFTLTLLTLGVAQATEHFDPKQAETFESERWAKTELLTDDHPAMIQEAFIPLVAQKEPETVKAFGSPTPPSSKFLLHYAKGWEEAQNPVPVLLIHGAALTSTDCYADDPVEQPYEGLAACLVRSGRKTFAITFSHFHGDNFLQAEAVADAIARIREVTGAKQVDLIAHSKGGMSARIYLSSAGRKWSTKFRGDVRRYVMLGTPNGGIDVSFAYPNLNYWILENKSAAPMSWTEGLYYGKWLSWEDRTIYGEGNPFPGQNQMLARWDGPYGRTTQRGQFDVDTTYEGGRGTVSVSKGIDQAIKDGGDTMAYLEKKAIDPSVELAVLAGSSPWVMHLVGERRAPSDGLLLVASAFNTDAMTKRGAKVLKKETLMLNHLQLVYHPRANDWVVEVLDQE